MSLFIVDCYRISKDLRSKLRNVLFNYCHLKAILKYCLPLNIIVTDLGDIYVSPALSLGSPFKLTRKWKWKKKKQKQLTTGIKGGCHLNTTNIKGILPGTVHTKPTSCSRERSNALWFYFLSVGKQPWKVKVTEGHRVYVAAMTNRKPEPCLWDSSNTKQEVGQTDETKSGAWPTGSWGWITGAGRAAGSNNTDTSKPVPHTPAGLPRAQTHLLSLQLLMLNGQYTMYLYQPALWLLLTQRKNFNFK